MQFITDLIVSGLVAYLAFTNHLATEILALMGNDVPETTEQQFAEAPPALATLPSLFGGKSIPDILLESIAYQQAVVIDAVPRDEYVRDPLLALVNIYCTFTTDNTIQTTTGTGFFISSDGVILTNAHVAQYLLLETTDLLGEAECIIRQGDPATSKYQAELLYMPPAWVQENASVIDAVEPTGTGERDYALLYVAASVTDEPLPARFPALKIATSELVPTDTREATVTAAGYPATEFIKNGAATPLVPQSAETTISELYTFGSNRADIIALRGSIIGAAGSSGGPILNEQDEVVGVIVTRGNDLDDGSGSLRAITLSHIARTITEETGFSLAENLAGDLPYRSQVFQETLSPFLISLLSTELQN
jgi:S1-C subfamily serine protease